MQAILIATGAKRKLHPLTTTISSSMIPIADRPVLVYAVELLARAGIRDIFITLSEPDQALQNYFGNGARWNVRLHYLYQPTTDSVIAVLQQAAMQVTETTLILPADALVDLDIPAAHHFHQQQGSMATAILSDNLTVQPAYPSFATLDADCRLQTDGDRAEDSRAYHSTGAFICEPPLLAAIAALPAATDHDLLTALCQAAQAENTSRIYGYMMDGYWNPLLSFQDFQAAQTTYLASLNKPVKAHTHVTLRHPYAEAGEVQPGVWVGPNSIIHPSVRLTAPIFIGAGCRIGRDVEIGPNTVIGSGVVLDEGVTIQESTILPYTYVGQFLHLAQRVAYHAELIDVVTGVNVQIADPWLLSSIKPTLPTDMVRAGIGKVRTALAVGWAGWIPSVAWFNWTHRPQPGAYNKHIRSISPAVKTQGGHLRYRERESQPFVVASLNE